MWVEGMLKAAGKTPRKSQTERVLRLSLSSPARGFSRAVVIGGSAFARVSSGVIPAGFSSSLHRPLVSSPDLSWTQGGGAPPQQLRFRAHGTRYPLFC